MGNDLGHLKVEMFPEEYIQLQLELRHHPDVVELLQRHNEDEHLDVKIIQICTHLEIILDGMYDQKDFNKLAAICTEKLKQRRLYKSGIQIVHQMPEGLQ